MKSSIHLLYGIIIGVLICACTGGTQEDVVQKSSDAPPASTSSSQESSNSPQINVSSTNQPTNSPLKRAKQAWEYKIHQFSRDDGKYHPRGFMGVNQDILDGFGNSGWEYAGPMCNNGTNAFMICFKRPK